MQSQPCTHQKLQTESTYTSCSVWGCPLLDNLLLELLCSFPSPRRITRKKRHNKDKNHKWSIWEGVGVNLERWKIFWEEEKSQSSLGKQGLEWTTLNYLQSALLEFGFSSVSGNFGIAASISGSENHPVFFQELFIQWTADEHRALCWKCWNDWAMKFPFPFLKTSWPQVHFLNSHKDAGNYFQRLQMCSTGHIKFQSGIRWMGQDKCDLWLQKPLWIYIPSGIRSEQNQMKILAVYQYLFQQ